MGRSRIRGSVARVVASIALGLGVGFGMLGVGLVHATDDSSWTIHRHSQQVVAPDTTSQPTFTTFDSSWT